MKKQPKIAIKYSEENWPEIKKAVDLLRSKGFSVVKRKTQLKQYGTLDDVYLMPDINNWGWNWDFMYGAKYYDCELLDMPQDFEKLKSYFEEEQKPKFEAGKWYSYKTEFYNHILLNLENKRVGFENGNWVEFYDGSIISNNYKPADMTKVKELLIVEAERIGYKKGVHVASCLNGREYVLNVSAGHYHDCEGLRVGGVLVFSNETGKWAEIIEEKPQRKTPSEAINSPKRLTKQIEKLERRVIELKDAYNANELERSSLQIENGFLRDQLKAIASQPEIIDQVKKIITE